MKKAIMTFGIANLVMCGSYLWGADHNRILCCVLWFLFPLANAFIYGLFENTIFEK